MAIRARTENECFDLFVKHVSGLVSKLLSNRYTVYCPRPPKNKPQNRRTLSFSNRDHDDAIPLETRNHGTIYFYLGQELSVVPDGELKRLRTDQYWYKLFAQSPTVCGEPIIRWEYARVARVHDSYCRHHVQFGKMVPRTTAGDGEFDLTHLHTPTGWVLMEEICRFLVCDFGVVPPCGSAWPKVLSEYAAKFYSSYTDAGGSGHSPNE